MLADIVSEKIYKLPENYIEMVDNYIEHLIEKSKSNHLKQTSNNTWNNFFYSKDLKVSPDFMQERSSQEQKERESF